MRTLHELAQKLQDFIIKSQSDAHNQTNMNITKYNNLKLKTSTKVHFPHVVVCIGISEATFNIEDGTKTDGGLGPDEKYVRKWLGSSTVIADLKEIYLSMSDLIKAEDEDKALQMEGEADEAKKDAPRKNIHHSKELISASLPDDVILDDGPELISMDESMKERTSQHVQEEDDGGPQTVDEMKQGLADYLKSMFRKQ